MGVYRLHAVYTTKEWNINPHIPKIEKVIDKRDIQKA
jgi:hypothetical protein